MPRSHCRQWCICHGIDTGIDRYLRRAWLIYINAPAARRTPNWLAEREARTPRARQSAMGGQDTLGQEKFVTMFQKGAGK